MISRDLKEKNYFLVEPEYEQYFNEIKKYIENNIKQGEIFFRARTGAYISASNFRFESNKEQNFYTPFQNNEIGAPLISIAGPGRVNRPGVSYLYLATDINTAISEIRPHPSEIVSVGEFTAKHDLLIADVSQHSLTEQLLTDDGLDLLELIIGIENTLSKAISPGNSTFYGITQFITEMLRKQGFDGICFRSSVGKGKNVVVFDPNNFEWRDTSGKVFSITHVTYSFEESEIFDENEHYDKIHENRLTI